MSSGKNTRQLEEHYWETYVDVSLEGYCSILIMSYFTWSGALQSLDLLLPHPVISLAYHISIILISPHHYRYMGIHGHCLPSSVVDQAGYEKLLAQSSQSILGTCVEGSESSFREVCLMFRGLYLYISISISQYLNISVLS